MKVKIKEEMSPSGGRGTYNFLISKNGYQWSGMSDMTLCELDKIHEKLTEFLREHGFDGEHI